MSGDALSLGDLPFLQEPEVTPANLRYLPRTDVPPRRSVAPAQAPAPARRELNWELVARLRNLASQELSERLPDRAASGFAGADSIDQAERDQTHQVGRQIIEDLLREEVRGDIANARGQVMTLAEQQAIAEAVFDAVFRMGRLQPLLDEVEIENIEIYGADKVVLEFQDGRLEYGPPVAESDQELISFLQFIASRSAVNAREFSESSPQLHLRLDDGSRLAAVAWVTPRPQVVIRRHRLREVTLDDLERNGTITSTMKGLFRAAVKAQRSIVVAGPQGAGKTTLVRALAAEIPPWVRIATFETEYELHLHEMPEQHRRVAAFEARPGTGEPGPNGRMAGELSLSDLLTSSLRMNIQVMIVGEVRGPEIAAMIKAMQSGTGSISTTHSKSAKLGMEKLITCALEAGASEAYAKRALASAIDLVAYVDLETSSIAPGEDARGVFRRRYVTEVVAVDLGGESENGMQITDVFTANPGGGPGRATHLPPNADELARYGFDVARFNREAGK